MKKMLGLLLSGMLMFGMVGCSSEETTGSEYSVLHGETLEATLTEDNTLVIKVKIKSNATKRMTIQQNAYNIENLVKSKGCDQFDKIDYWAVADMTDGTESKVFACTINKDVINGIKEGTIVANQIIDRYATDVYILPSLK